MKPALRTLVPVACLSFVGLVPAAIGCGSSEDGDGPVGPTTTGVGGGAGGIGASGGFGGAVGGAGAAAGAGASTSSGGSAAGGGGSGTTTVRIHYDAGLGNHIAIRGESAGLSWTTGQACTWTDGNIWQCELPDATSAVTFKPLLNDEDWAFGWNWMVELGATLDIYPHFYETEGRFETHADVASTHLTEPRDVVVYLPPGYDENPLESYPVLFMHDGQNLFDPLEAFGGVEWEIDEAVDTLASWGGIEEMIVVGVGNTPERLYEYTPTVDSDVGDGGGADLYLQFLAEELRPFIDASYRTRGTRSGIAGSSLGGLVSLWGCWQRPDDFDRCGVFSPSLWWDNGYVLTTIGADTATAADKNLRIYLDSGDSGPSNDGMDDTIAMRELLITKGFVLDEDLSYVLGVGMSHNEAAWAARAPGALEWLYADPARVDM